MGVGDLAGKVGSPKEVVADLEVPGGLVAGPVAVMELAVGRAVVGGGEAREAAVAWARREVVSVAEGSEEAWVVQDNERLSQVRTELLLRCWAGRSSSQSSGCTPTSYHHPRR